MHKVQSPVTGDQKLRPNCGRKPLQPRNSLANPVTEIQILKPKKEWIEIPLASESNKENHHPICTATPTKLVIEPLDASLAEELSAIRKKIERLRLDRQKTEKMLNEREGKETRGNGGIGEWKQTDESVFEFELKFKFDFFAACGCVMMFLSFFSSTFAEFGKEANITPVILNVDVIRTLRFPNSNAYGGVLFSG
ncbi:hypothetical protein GH714_019904 [Hevea brasiliensis]|uniref:Uncharacterized protein n=1 Tax=Hevea brasiliensis TaxID=3981 RepID=A0A6A6M3T6_HEVBR|nr:hypothetical protein GH714_019904 [Hevea brasiliensis]